MEELFEQSLRALPSQRVYTLREAELATGLVCKQRSGTLNTFLNCQIGTLEIVRPKNGETPEIIWRLIGFGATWRDAIGMVKAKREARA